MTQGYQRRIGHFSWKYLFIPYFQSITKSLPSTYYMPIALGLAEGKRTCQGRMLTHWLSGLIPLFWLWSKYPYSPSLLHTHTSLVHIVKEEWLLGRGKNMYLCITFPPPIPTTSLVCHVFFPREFRHIFWMLFNTEIHIDTTSSSMFHYLFSFLGQRFTCYASYLEICWMNSFKLQRGKRYDLFLQEH